MTSSAMSMHTQAMSACSPLKLHGFCIQRLKGTVRRQRLGIFLLEGRVKPLHAPQSDGWSCEPVGLSFRCSCQAFTDSA